MVLIFAFFGVEVALVPSGEIRDPAKTVPRSLFLALAVTTAVYVGIQAVARFERTAAGPRRRDGLHVWLRVG
jgi:amino acid transporter